MKQFKHLIIYLSIFCIVTVSIFSVSSKKVYAEISGTQKAVAHSASWGTYSYNSKDFNYINHEKYWTVQDATGIPTSTLVSPVYFYTSNNDGKFYDVNGSDLIQLILSRGINLILEPSIARALITAFFAAIGDPVANNIYVQGALYDANNNFLGYCLNDITDCYYYAVQPVDKPALEVPSQQTNNVYEFTQCYFDDTLPDYFTYYPPSIDSIFGNFVSTATPENVALCRSRYSSYLSDNNFIGVNGQLTENNTLQNFQGYSSSYPFTFIKIPKNYYFIAYQDQQYQDYTNLCEAYNINKNNTELLYTDVISDLPLKSNMRFNIYDPSNDTKLNQLTYYNLIEGTTLTVNLVPNLFGSYDVYNALARDFLGGGPITFYKDLTAYSGIKNQTYIQDSYNTDSYNNYSTSNNNSFNTTYNEVINSNTTNQNIYNNVNDNFYENVENYTIDVTLIQDYTQYTINHYYPEQTEDPDDPTNPEDPDNPSDPEDPETILDAILDALRRFFAIIGRLLGTVLAGLLEVIDALLESIAGIMENLTGVTDFIGALFSWLPTPVPQVLGVGLSICILAAIIKFIRG